MTTHLSEEMLRRANMIGQDSEAAQIVVKTPSLARRIFHEGAKLVLIEGRTLRLRGSRKYRDGRFVARERFVPHKAFVHRSRGPHIVSLGKAFRERILNAMETDVPSEVIREWTLEGAAGDREIIDNLHGRHITKLCYVYQCLELQPQGEGGFLSLDKANIFYVEISEGNKKEKTLFAITPIWSSHGWHLGGHEVAKFADAGIIPFTGNDKAYAISA